MDGLTGSMKLRQTAEDVIGTRQVEQLDSAIDDTESVENVRGFERSRL